MHVGKSLILQEPGLSVSVQEGSLRLRMGGELVQKFPLVGVGEVVLFSQVVDEGRCIAALVEAGISVSRISYSGAVEFMVDPPSDSRVLLRIEQYRAHFDEERRLELAKNFVVGKLKNQKKELRRLAHSRKSPCSVPLAFIDARLSAARSAATISQLMGEEGMAARAYFESWGRLLSPIRDGLPWEQRTRRPPRSPEDALLSFTYALLASACKGAVASTGLDSHLGFLHSPSAGRASLGLDLMEEFRAGYADRLVATVINRREFAEGDFVETLGSYSLTDVARKRFLKRWSSHMDEKVTYPALASPIPRRAVPYWQARLLAGSVLEGSKYRSYVTAEGR